MGERCRVRMTEGVTWDLEVSAAHATEQLGRAKRERTFLVLTPPTDSSATGPSSLNPDHVLYVETLEGENAG